MLGDFDGDGSDELICGNIFVQPPKSKGTVTAESIAKSIMNMREDYHWVELDGTIRTQRRAAWIAQWDKTGWDFDGDGIDELGRHFMHSDSSFCKPDGTTVGKLSGRGFSWQDNQADFNGDGKMDIVLRTDRPEALLIYAHDGKGLGKIPYPEGWSNPVFGNFTDKKRAVALFVPSDGRKGANQEFLLIGLDGKQRQMRGYPLDIWQSWPAHCGDLNGDGYDEVLAQNGGYFDLRSGKYVAFQNPQPSYYEPYYQPGTTIACDISGDGKPELISALTEIDSAEYDDVLLVAYNLQGKSIYTERLTWFPIMMQEAYDGEGFSYLILAGHEEVRIVP